MCNCKKRVHGRIIINSKVVISTTRKWAKKTRTKKKESPSHFYKWQKFITHSLSLSSIIYHFILNDPSFCDCCDVSSVFLSLSLLFPSLLLINNNNNRTMENFSLCWSRNSRLSQVSKWRNDERMQKKINDNRKKWEKKLTLFFTFSCHVCHTWVTESGCLQYFLHHSGIKRQLNSFCWKRGEGENWIE